MSTKYCPQCDQTLATTAFQKNASRSDGLSGWCKECTQVAVIKWKALNPERLRVHSQTWYDKHKAAQS